ncbi:glycosyltransferase family 2 protein [Leptospira yasudae]|uniref:glycosyltransferase family 2 protein n=1 Tax=Leptospira yasudae TaxID=2202201 RepID=UPI0010914D26|nr:glycosyltransferase family A protein [Leptospira yasudae]TGM96651.1 glycosyltransferase family 2 protein [Leptospira yasudae]
MRISPLVSVIIPCYNYGRFVEETIQSIVQQTYSNWEIILVDDGSDDRQTLETLEKIRDTYPNVTLLRIDKSGPSKARNFGIKHSKGEFILPLDSDDKIHSCYMEEAIGAFNENLSLGIVYCEAEFFGSMKGKWNLPEYKFPDIILENCIFVSAFFKKADWEYVGGFSENMKNEWEDYDFWLKLIELGRTVYRIPKVFFYYRRGHVSRSKHNLELFLPLYLQLFTNHKQLYLDNIHLLFQRHMRAKELEEQIYVLSKIPLLWEFIKFLSRSLTFLALVKRKFF